MFQLLFLVFLVGADVTGLQANPVTCMICQAVMSGVSSDAAGNLTLDAVTKAVASACRVVKMEDWCMTNIVPQIAAILQDLKDNDTPDAICSLIKLCDPTLNNDAIVAAQQNSVLVSAIQVGGDPFSCLLCESIMTGVENLIKSNVTFNAVASLVATTCDKLKIDDWCMVYLIPNLQNIYNDLILKQDPTQVCFQIKLCNKRRSIQ